jgi:hypothetical protein
MSDKLHYMAMHVIAAIFQIVLVIPVCWAAVQLENSWALLALVFVCRSYRHDFKPSAERGQG